MLLKLFFELDLNEWTVFQMNVIFKLIDFFNMKLNLCSKYNFSLEWSESQNGCWKFA